LEEEEKLLQVILGVTAFGHQRQKPIVGDIQQAVFSTLDDGDFHVVGGGANILQLLSGEDINGNEVDLGVAMLSGLGSGGFDDLARATLDDNVSTLSDSRSLSRDHLGGVILDLFKFFISHFAQRKGEVDERELHGG
jgi:hypothetical protein